MRFDLSLKSELAAAMLGLSGALSCFWGAAAAHAAAQCALAAGPCWALLGADGAIALYFLIPCYSTYFLYLNEESSDFHILFPVLAFAAGAGIGGSG
ncbi:MAG: hypothetical protein HXY22_04995 [Alphaproteobacteria bacterium]|nr:hypothetical protein [Alphaproteobacteria bacterium]